MKSFSQNPRRDVRIAGGGVRDEPIPPKACLRRNWKYLHYPAAGKGATLSAIADNSPKPSLLILDVDETLLFATERRLAHAPDFRFGPYHVYLRPYLQEFLQRCYRRYRIVLWSTADAGYLAAVRTYALPADLHVEFVWSRDRCVRCYDPEWRETYYVKDLRKVRRRGYDLARTLIVDDTPQKVERSYGNAIYVPEFRGEPEDDLLRRLANYLETLADTADVRGLEKRNWKAHY